MLEETIKYLKDEGKCICLHPGMWIQFPYRKRKPTFLQGKIDNIEICLKNDISKMDACSTMGIKLLIIYGVACAIHLILA